MFSLVHLKYAKSAQNIERCCPALQGLTSTIFILTHAGTDFVTCLITIPFTIAMEALHFDIKLDFFCKFYHFLITTTVPFSAFVMVTVAVDRYLCICHPYLRWMTERRAKIIITCLAIFIFIYGGMISSQYSVYDSGEMPNWQQNRDYGGVIKSGNPDDAFHTEMTRDPNDNVIAWLNIGKSPARKVYSANHTTTSPTLNTTGASRMMMIPAPFLTSSNSSWKTIRYHNNTFQPTDASICTMRINTVNSRFFHTVHVIYSWFFLVCCVAILVLYSLVYHSIVTQRCKKLRVRTAACCFMWNSQYADDELDPAEITSDLELSQVKGDPEGSPDEPTVGGVLFVPQNGSALVKPRMRSQLERLHINNIKTAAMLFAVALVFICSFLPAWLIALQVIHAPLIVFYTYFFYNVANPFIYACMNRTFRRELKNLLRCPNRH